MEDIKWQLAAYQAESLKIAKCVVKDCPRYILVNDKNFCERCKSWYCHYHLEENTYTDDYYNYCVSCPNNE